MSHNGVVSVIHGSACVVSHIFGVSGDNVQFVCNMTESVPFCNMMVDRNMKFLGKIHKYHLMLGVLNYLFCSRNKHELFQLLSTDAPVSYTHLTLPTNREV